MATAGLGSITATPNIAGNRRFKSYLNQSMATTGRTPSPATLDQIIQSELDAMGRRVQEQQRFGLDLARTEEAKRQFDISQNNALDTAKAGRESSLISTGLGAGTTLMGFNALRGKPLLGDTISGGIDKLFGLGKATTPGVVNTGAGMGKGLISGGAIPPLGDSSLAATAGEIGAETIPPVIQAGEASLGSAAIPAATGTSIAASTALPGAVEYGTPAADAILASMDAAEAGVAAEGAGAGLGLSSVALPLAAYEGMRFLGDNVVGGTLGDFLKKPITGVGSYGLSKLSDITGVKELGHAGKFLGDVEETLIQKPIDAVTGFIGDVASTGGNFISDVLGFHI